MSVDVETLIISLFEIEAVKFGNFVLKSGISSPVYFDLRVIVSAPRILTAVAENLQRLAQDEGISFDGGDGDNVVAQLCGVPYTALPIATVMSTNVNVPMIIRRKEAKEYGTKKLLEGKWNPGNRCLVVEDVVTSGSSVLETAKVLREANLRVDDAVVILDRQQGGERKLADEGIRLRSLFTISDVLKVLLKKRLIGSSVVDSVETFIAENQFTQTPPPPSRLIDATKMKFENRVEDSDESLSGSLFALMERKCSNLCVAADATFAQDLLDLADSVGPYICILKTHVDIVEDFDALVIEKLLRLATRHDFMLFEDRKFADIGNTVMAQYGKGIYKMADWADIVNAHPLPGPGVVQGLKTVAEGSTRRRGCLLVAEMSSTENLISKDYAKAALEMALDHRPFVCGFIAQSRLSNEHPEFVFMTPGVNLEQKGDKLGQNYATPRTAVLDKGADVIIVGRGVSKAEDPAKAAALYKKEGWQAYLDRIS